MEVNLPTMTKDLQSRIIINVAVGKGNSEKKVNFETENGSIESLSIADSIMRCFLFAAIERAGMPLNQLFPSMLSYAVHSSDKRHVRNTNYLKTVLQ